MKKIIVGFMALAFLVTAHSAFAAEWNSDPNDCRVPLAVGNYTTNVGIRNGTYGCWTLTSVSASSGDTINVRAYYDNTSGQPQANVKIKLTPLSSGSSSTHTFKGSISSNLGNFDLGTVTINLASPASLEYGYSVWKKNDGSQTTFNGNDVINGGQSIGTVPSTMPTSPNLDGQGSLVAVFRVGSTQQPQVCQDPNASNYGGALPCRYPTPVCTISNFTANGSTSSTTIQSGAQVNLVWNTTGFTTVNVSGPNANFYSLNGSEYIYPTYSATYTLTASGYNCQPQTLTRTVTVNVIQVDNNICKDYNASNYNGYLPCQYPQQVCKDYSASNYNGSLPCQYPQSLCKDYNATNYNGTLPCRYPIIPVITNTTCAVTTVAINVSQTSATLNGLISNSTGNSYFEYGPTTNFGSRTTARYASGQFSDTVTGLSPGTTYYFRFVSQCQGGGVSYGQVQYFQTTATVKNTTTTTIVRQPTVVQGTTVIGTQSPIMLKIENRYQCLATGSVVDYTVTYKNISNLYLSRPVLQVIVPKGVTIINASAGTFSNDTNTLTVPLADLRPGDEGVIYLQGHVDSIPSDTAQIVTTAVLVYTTPNGAQENAIAYVLNNPCGLVNNLGAAAFFGGIFPSTLLGWLLLIIIILLIILATRRYAHRSYTTTTMPTAPGVTHTTTTY